MKRQILTLPSIALAAVGCQQPQQVKPNVVLIVADDLGFGDVSCYGSTTLHTPNIDSLASDGLLFNRGYATSATSSPSRYAMFTGMYPWRVDMKILPGDAPLMISEDMPTMPRMFQEQGYATGAIGKWHLGMGDGFTDWNKPIVPSANAVGFDFTNLIPATVDRVPTVYVEDGVVQGLDPDDPISVSYDHQFPGEITGRDHPELMSMPFSHGHDGTIVNGIPRIGHMVGGKAAQWDDKTMADYFLAKAEGFIDAHADGPFFLYYGLHEPHVPRSPETRFEGATPFGPRGDVIAEADWLVGQIVSHLRDKGLLENTIIIVTSDNGPVVDDGYKDDSVEKLGAHDPCGGLRGGKYSLFDGGTHIPMLISWEGHIKPGISDAYVCQMDFYASFAHLLGAEIPDSLDSEDHLDALFGKDLVGRKEQVIEAQGRLAYRQGDYVLIPPYKGEKFNQTGNEVGNLDDYGLFNIKEDKGQKTDIAAFNKEIVDRLKTSFEKAAAGYWSPDPEVEALQ